jgi:hypothetical protein
MSLFGSIPILSSFARAVTDIITLKPAHFVRDVLETYKGPAQLVHKAISDYIPSHASQNALTLTVEGLGAGFLGGGGSAPPVLQGGGSGSYLDTGTQPLGPLFTDQTHFDNNFSGGAPWLTDSTSGLALTSSVAREASRIWGAAPPH